MADLLNETWPKTIDDVDYVFFRTAAPLGMRVYYGFEQDWIGGCNEVGGNFVFAAEFATEPTQANVEAQFPL